MTFVRIALERLLLLVFAIVQAAFLAQGLALCTALLATPWSQRQDAPAWMEVALRAVLGVGATLFGSGVVLALARRLPAASGRGAAERGGVPGMAEDAQPAWTWALLLGLTLAVLPALAWSGAAPLVAFWREILELLREIGFWDELPRSGPYSGIVILPILIALFVPALETAAAFFLIALPLASMVLLLARSRAFPRLFAMMVTCQAGLVLASLLASDAFAKLAAEASASMTATGDAELLPVVEGLGRAQSVLTACARALAEPLFGFLLWVPPLLGSQRIRSFFTVGTIGTPAPPGLAAPADTVAVRLSATDAAPAAPVSAGRAPAATPTTAPDGRARAALVALGALLLLFCACESLRPRAAYESSEPAAGATVSAPPAAVRVRFGRALDPSSSLAVTRVFADPAPGEVATRIATSSSLDPGDGQRRTLQAELPALPSGLYRVQWHAAPASGGGIERHGAFYFGVGEPLPEPLPGADAPLEERDARARGRRHALAGGLLLVALGALMPWLPRHPDRSPARRWRIP